jgi:hypothetical protein
MRESALLLLVVGVVQACGGSQVGRPTAASCGAGRTELDGVCVSEKIADYVACVRAQGAHLGSDRANKLSAEAGYLGVRASGASEVKETLEKKYSVSAASELEIVRACSGAAGLSGPAPVAENAPPPPSGDGLERGLVGSWSFDEASGATARDTAGKKGDGFLDPGLERAEGKVGKALRFIGGSRAVQVTSATALHAPRELTLALWARPATLGSTVMLWKAGPEKPDGRNIEYGLWMNGEGQVVFVFGTEAFAGKYSLYIQTSKGALVAGQWHHIAAVSSRETGMVAIWVNGTKYGEARIDDSQSSHHREDGPLLLGNNTARTMGFVGLLDDVRIYDRVLTPAEIEELARK